MLAPSRRHTRTREAVFQAQPACLDAPAHTAHVELGLAHALRAACEHELRDARLHLHTTEHDRLKPRTTATVELHSRRLDRQTGVERGDATECGRLAVGVALAEDHVLDSLGGKRRPRDQRADHARGEILDRHVAKDATKATHGRSQRFTDDSVAHGRRAYSAEQKLACGDDHGRTADFNAPNRLGRARCEGVEQRRA